MSEPTDGNVEPTNAPEEKSEETVEPTTPEEEPAKPEGDAVEKEEEKPEVDSTEVDYMDLKTVPKELQKAAKKMQSEYTKKMQSAREEAIEKMKFSGFEEKGEEVDPAMEDKKAKVREFISTPEGAAFKEVMTDLVKDYVGDTPQTVREMQIAKDVDSVTAKYGEENIAKHIDTIEEVAQKYPNAPLELVVRSVLYDGAKKLGEDELKGKIQKKAEMSDPSKPSPTGTVPNKSKTPTFDEAFEEALKV